MAQFDVYRNPSVSTREAIPYVVDVQSDLLDGLSSRLTVPLGTATSLPAMPPRNLCPLMEFEGLRLYALPQFAAPFRVRDLGRPLGSLAHQSHHLVAALDAVISGV